MPTPSNYKGFYVAEIIIAGLVMIAIIMALTDLPGSALITVLSLGLLAVLYFPLGMFFLFPGTSTVHPMGASVGFVFSLECSSILFNGKLWSGFEVLYYTALPLGIIVLFYSLYQWLRADDWKIYRGLFIRQFLLGMLLGVSWLHAT